MKSPLDFIPRSAQENILVEHGYMLDLPIIYPDIWMCVVCLYLFHHVEHVAHDHGFSNWAERFAWFKNSTAKKSTFWYFNPSKVELHLAPNTNIFLHPFECEFLYLCLDFFTTAFFLVPGTEVYEAFCIMSVLLDSSYIPINKIKSDINNQGINFAKKLRSLFFILLESCF